MTTGTQPVEEELKNILVEQLQVNSEDVTPSAVLMGDLGADSLDMAELCLQCEEAFGTQFSDSEVVKVKTVQDMVDLIKAKIG